MDTKEGVCWLISTAFTLTVVVQCQLDERTRPNVCLYSELGTPLLCGIYKVKVKHINTGREFVKITIGETVRNGPNIADEGEGERKINRPTSSNLSTVAKTREQ